MLSVKGSGNEGQDVLKTLKSRPDDFNFSLNIANGLFLKEGFVPLPDFMSKLRSDLNAYVDIVNFESMEGVKSVNAWVEKETNGNITNVINEPDGCTVMTLINTVYMQGMWAERFKILFNGNFKVSKSKTVETILMRKVGMLPYFCDKKAKFAVAFIPYLSSKYIGKIEMGVLLPDDGANIDSFAEYLRNDSLPQMRSKALFRTLDVILPKKERKKERIYLSGFK